MSPATSESDFEDDLQEYIDAERMFEFKRNKLYDDTGMSLSVFSQELYPDTGGIFDEENPYSVKHRSEQGNEYDKTLPLIKEWHLNPDSKSFTSMSKKDLQRFMARAKNFFVDGKDRLYRRPTSGSGMPQLVVDRDKRMRILYGAHDSVGHKGMFATQEIIEKRFWWPDLAKDVHWYVLSCLTCQLRQL